MRRRILSVGVVVFVTVLLIGYLWARAGAGTITNSIGMKFKQIPAGSFLMGASDTQEKYSEREKPQHLVEISAPFYMGIFEVTQAQWEKVMDNTPSKRKGSNMPVTNVSWDDVQEFIRKLSEKEGIEYRLPTEAEWEYACRAGTTTRYFWGDDYFDLQYVWGHPGLSSRNFQERLIKKIRKTRDGLDGWKIHPVGVLNPNAWGLFDTGGNVWEWCEDWYAAYPGEGKQTDPRGPSSGEKRVIRGGALDSKAGGACESYSRSYRLPSDPDEDIGFRLVREG
jgi:formylglycine-generating enzyme required for sulfatase activity